MPAEIVKAIATENGEDIFQIRVIKNEGVGLLTTQSGANYLILDSADYWREVIADGFPKIVKCSCKNDRFKIKFIYGFREQAGDIKHIDVISECVNCHKISNRLSIDIDYSPTDDLLTRPIAPCANPRLKYDYKNISGLWADKIDKIIAYIVYELGFDLYCWYYHFGDQRYYFERSDPENIIKLITPDGKVSALNTLFIDGKIDANDLIDCVNERGTIIKNRLWQKYEIINLNTVSVVSKGRLFMLTYCPNYIRNDKLESKSAAFSAKTAQLDQWLKGL